MFTFDISDISKKLFHHMSEFTDRGCGDGSGVYVHTVLPETPAPS